MAFKGLTHTGPQCVFQFYDKEPNQFNEEVKKMTPVEDLPDEMRDVKWTKDAVNLADLYPDQTPLRQLRKDAEAKTRKTINEFTSSSEYRESLTKHSRLTNNPQEKFYAPLTSNQQYGWSDKPPGAAQGVGPDPKYYKNTSEEGRYAEAMTRQGMI
eukprot:TRINITY_DN30153_c0_g1_i1.p1 TRINITY_DN30153_c0_g1~~TRINITY_DN30153_c0_g1_i1.p1  ORF type:complete len:156 (+),score=53.86 TRINITY_DN30153_c0_g1_i1:64-531(+)